MIFVDPVDNYSTNYLTMVQSEANGCLANIKNTENSVVSFSPGQTVAYLDYRSKGYSLPWVTASVTTFLK